MSLIAPFSAAKLGIVTILFPNEAFSSFVLGPKELGTKDHQGETCASYF
jgi:hypothetical protein